MLSLVLGFYLHEDPILWGNFPLEELFVPSLKNFDYYVNGSYSRWELSTVSLDFNSVPGPSRLSLFGAAGVGEDTVYSLFLMNYSRYMGIIDLGFNLFLSRYEYGGGLAMLYPGATLNLSTYVKRVGLGGGVSYLTNLRLHTSDGRSNTLGVYLFYRRGDFHAGRKGFRVILGYLHGNRRMVQVYASFKFLGVYPFLTLHYPSYRYGYILKAGLRLTVHRFNLYGGVMGGKSSHPLGYVLSVGTQLPR